MNAIDTKNELFGMIHCEGTIEEKCQNWNRVLDTLLLTQGLWSELEYAYKAVEIAEAIRGLSANEQELQENICQHWKIHHKNAELLSNVSHKAYSVQMIFHSLKHS